MSRTWWAWGSLLNSAQLHLATGFGPTLSVNDQSSVLICGVGPSDRTGKSAVSDGPGGSRLAISGDCCRPVNPRVITCGVPRSYAASTDMIFTDNDEQEHQAVATSDALENQHCSEQ